SFDQRRFKALLADGQVLGQRVVLAKPETYMNASGEAVGVVGTRSSLRVRW
ncbi:MAG: aminoacyl-tRNA hydrolase, partial [Firmicutes bacterium]|nr:aminoacyl-tRNA hydrolase [Bacillota bacterium]